MTDILIVATAGLKPDQITDTQHLKYPRVDYIELQKLINADILNYTIYNQIRWGDFFRRLETRVRADLYLAIRSLLIKRAYGTVFAMSERAGIPMAGLQGLFSQQGRFVSMFQCWSWRQEKAVTKLNLLTAIDSIIVHCKSMQHHLIQLGAPAGRVHLIPYSRDQFFFRPIVDIEPEPGFIFSVGETRSRDYTSLFQAINGLPLKLLVAASGGWDAREKNRKIQAPIPENVTIAQHFPLLELRNLYAKSQFVVVPVYDTIFSAGATVALEAMCMGRAVIATCSQGIVDYVIDGETGILVEPGNAQALREAIRYLAAHPGEARRMGQNGRQWVEETLNLDRYVQQLAAVLQSVPVANSPTRVAKSGVSQSESMIC